MACIPLSEGFPGAFRAIARAVCACLERGHPCLACCPSIPPEGRTPRRRVGLARGAVGRGSRGNGEGGPLLFPRVAGGAPFCRVRRTLFWWVQCWFGA